MLPLNQLVVCCRGAALTWFLACAVPPAWALDLSAAYAAALTQDTVIRAARASAAATQERLPQARAQWRPNLSLSASRNMNKLAASSTDALGQVQLSQSDYFSQNQTLTLRQTLLNRVKTLDVAQAGFQVADADALLALEHRNLLVRVGESYFNALLADDQIDLLLAQEALVQTQVDAAEKSFVAGAGTRTDIDEVQARLDLNFAQTLEARQNQGFARQQLSMLINQPVTALAPLDAQRLDLLQSDAQSLVHWQALAEASSPELQALQARAEVARLQVDKSRAGHAPTLDLVAQWSKSDSENVTRLSSDYDTRSVGLQLVLPLYAGGYVDSTVRQAWAEHARAQEAHEGARRDLAMRVHKEFRGVTEGVLRVKALQQAVVSASQFVLSSRKSASGGIRTQLDVLLAQVQEMQARRDLAQVRYMYLLARLRLSVLAGNPLPNCAADLNALLLSN